VAWSSGFLLGAMADENALHTVIALVACELEECALERGHGDCCRPWSRVNRRIIDRHLIVDRVGVEPGEPLDDTRFRAGAENDDAQHPVDGPVVDVGVVGGFDAKRAAIPPAARVPQPLLNLRAHMRTSVERNDPHVMDHLHGNHDVSRRLQDVIVVVVEVAHHRARQPARDASLEQVPALGSIGGAPPPPPRPPPLCLPPPPPPPPHPPPPPLPPPPPP